MSVVPCGLAGIANDASVVAMLDDIARSHQRCVAAAMDFVTVVAIARHSNGLSPLPDSKPADLRNAMGAMLDFVHSTKGNVPVPLRAWEVGHPGMLQGVRSHLQRGDPRFCVDVVPDTNIRNYSGKRMLTSLTNAIISQVRARVCVCVCV